LCNDWDESISLNNKPILGIPEGSYLEAASASALAHFNKLCNSLAEAGYELRRICILENVQEVRARHDLILAADAARVHEKWFKKYEILYSSKLRELVRRGQAISDSQLQDALYAREIFRAEMTKTMNANGIDLWICPPSTGPAPKGLENTGDPAMNLPWTQLGYPAVNIPVEKDTDGLPIGLQVVGKWNSDEELLAWAEEIETIVSRL